MNTTTTSTRLRGLIAMAIVGAVATSFTAVSAAADSTAAPTVIVKYEDLNTSNAQGAGVLYGRIRTAAEKVCRSFDERDLAFKKLQSDCVEKAIEGAVSTVNQPALSAIYNARHGTSLPTSLLSQTR